MADERYEGKREETVTPMEQDKGLILKKAREAKGLSLEAVHEATKIPLDVLKAIEEGYTVRTLSPFYHRGFLKMYANFLRVDIKEVMGDYKPPQSIAAGPDSGIPISHQEKPPQEAARKAPPILTLSTLTLFSAKAKKIKTMAKPTAKVLVFILAAFILFKIAAFVGHRIIEGLAKRKADVMTSEGAQAVSKKQKPASKEKVSAPAASAFSAKAPEAARTPSASESSSNQTNQKINLSVRVKKDIWLQVKVDGMVVFQSTLKRGAVESWFAKNTIELSGKDIGELELELNGKMIGPLSKKNRKAKKVIINQKGFSVQ